jgi:hypothetical protein
MEKYANASSALNLFKICVFFLDAYFQDKFDRSLVLSDIAHSLIVFLFKGDAIIINH